MPKVSVVMPAYNASKTIKESILSVLNQTYEDFELIIVNDCSKDETKKIISEFVDKDNRVVCFDNEVNSGASYSRNRAISSAKGEWIAFLDSDDIWKNDKLEKQMKLIECVPDATIVYTASSFINADGIAYSYVLPAEKETTYKTLLKKNLISCSSAVVKASIMKSIKMPNDSMHEDYFVWLTILKSHSCAYGINEPLLIYRLSNNSKSSNRIKSAKMIYNTYRAVGYSRFISFCLTLRYSIHSITKRSKIYKSK